VLVNISDDSNLRVHRITGPDETPVWSHDGSHILFGRRDGRDARTLWLMRADGSDTREVAGPFDATGRRPGFTLAQCVRLVVPLITASGNLLRWSRAR
jgi:hypothetical protein